ncbi:mitochondrial-processing peptidase subunit alpha isoform X2 [Physcomitrium patens]|uniref:mitochondrial-processing peptidase subunit alpha isoform X2 n=1 Tax=Physcomitrium patens TaxID=3218 RepID=UPI003CCC96B4
MRNACENNVASPSQTLVSRLNDLLGSQARDVHLSPTLCQVVPMYFSPKPKGILTWLAGDEPSNAPALHEPMPRVHLPPQLCTEMKPGGTKMTKLKNGVRIASENSHSPISTVGVYIDSGSVHESPNVAGVSHLLERMAFKSTSNRSHFRLVRDVEAIGGHVMANASREQMSCTADSIKTYMPHMVELLVDCVRNSMCYNSEVHDQLVRVKAETGEIVNNPQRILLEALHSAGYAGALGQPLLAPEASLHKLNEEVLCNFVSQNYTAGRIALAASGCDHDELLQIAEPLLSDMCGSGPPTPPATEYVGGDWRQAAESPKTNIALAFEIPGGWRNEKDSFAVTVLQTLLGGGGSFSAGGPGKGMYSRLYSQVLNKYEQVQSFTAFNCIYNQPGIFCIHATSGSEFVPHLVDLATKEFIAVATPGEVTEAEIQRAKNMTISAVLMNLESSVVVTEDIGRQILTYGNRKPVAEFIHGVQSLTLADLSRVAQKIIFTPLTMASWGDVTQVPRYDQVANRFS